MNTKAVATIETGIEGVAATAMAGALGYAVTTLLTGFYNLPIVPGMAAAAIAFTVVRSKLGKVDAPSVLGAARSKPEYPSLTLSDFARVGAPAGAIAGAAAPHGGDEDPLQLDDVIGEPGPDSHVVRMFGPSSTAGELVVRIDRHFAAGQPAPSPGDSEAMFEALDQLRQSLR